MSKPEPTTAEQLARAKRELEEITFINQQVLRALRRARRQLAERDKSEVVEAVERMLGLH